MTGSVLIFKQRISEALTSDYPRVDEVVEAYLDIKDAAEEKLIAELNEMSDRVPAIDENVVNAKAVVVEFLTAHGYNPESYIAAAEKARKLARKMSKAA